MDFSSRDRDNRRRRDSRSRSRERERERDRNRGRDRPRERDRDRDRSRRSRSRSADRSRSRTKPTNSRDNDKFDRRNRSPEQRRSNSKKIEFSLDGCHDNIKDNYSTSTTTGADEEVLNDMALQEIDEFLSMEEATETEEEKEQRLVEERRKRREEIMRKHSANQGEPGQEQKQQGAGTSAPDKDIFTDEEDIDQREAYRCAPSPLPVKKPRLAQEEGDSLSTHPHKHSDREVSSSTFNRGEEPLHSGGGVATQGDGCRTRQGIVGGSTVAMKPSGEADGAALEAERVALEAERLAVEEEEQREAATIAFDMFSASPTGALPHNGAGDRAGGRAKSMVVEGDDPLLESNWDDYEGYYKTRIGEVIGGRYQVMGEVGKGVFSTVLRCIDSKRHDEQVVLKVIRNNDMMRKASEKELSLLRMISDADPEGRKHCVRMLGQTEFRSHIVIAFEPMSMNLREALKKFGKNVGINVTAVRMYGKQLFIGLRHLADLRIVHADIKLDNIVVSGDLKHVKLCDFGSAFLETDPDNVPTPYLVSRFYRAPEIILGLPYDRQIDIWSVAVSLYELFTGHVMVPGRSNNEMLKIMMELKGRFPNKMLRASQRSYETLELEHHFDSDFKFKLKENDPVTGKDTTRLLEITNPSKDLATVLLSSKAGADDRALVVKLADLLEKCLILDPAKRSVVSDALKHPFFHIAKK